MNAPQRDPLNAMFDQYAATTAAETTRATPGQLRRRMHRHRTARVAAVGVAAAVLAVPGGWMFQQAGASDGPTGAADQGTAAEPSEEPASCPAVALTLTAIVDPEGTDLEEFIASDEVRAMMSALPEDSDITGYRDDPEIKIVLIPGVDDLEHYIDPEDYGVTVATDGDLAEDVVSVEVRAERLAVDCVETPTETPTDESGTPGGDPTESESEAGEETTGAGEEPTGVYEQSTPAGDESQTEESTPGESESPTPGDDEEVSASESSTP